MCLKIVRCLKQHIKDTFFDMHMMVVAPEKWVKDVAESGGSQYTFHIEATQSPEECIRLIKENGMKVGLALSPKTPVESILPFVNDIDMALIMTVEPGQGGQKFMHDMMSKVEFLRKQFEYLNISVDGGVGPSTLDVCLKHGANMIVSGSAITSSKNRKETIDSMKQLMDKYFK
jgi:ribulose-phosphate 3-epimerase